MELSRTDKDIITTSLSQIKSIEGYNRDNLINSVTLILGDSAKYFSTLTHGEKMEALTVVTVIFDALLDADANPQTRRFILKALHCFNNNIREVAK